MRTIDKIKADIDLVCNMPVLSLQGMAIKLVKLDRLNNELTEAEAQAALEAEG